MVSLTGNVVQTLYCLYTVHRVCMYYMYIYTVATLLWCIKSWKVMIDEHSGSQRRLNFLTGLIVVELVACVSLYIIYATCLPTSVS